MTTIQCPICNTTFKVRPYRLKRISKRTGKKVKVYCSAECSFKGRQNPNFECATCGKTRRYYEGKSTKYCSKKCFGLGNRDENNYLWKGDKASYRVKHHWIKHRLGKASYCEFCGLDKIPKGKKRYFEWANISRKHHRDVSDYISLCCKCHGKFDSEFRNSIA